MCQNSRGCTAEHTCSLSPENVKFNFHICWSQSDWDQRVANRKVCLYQGPMLSQNFASWGCRSTWGHLENALLFLIRKALNDQDHSGYYQMTAFLQHCLDCLYKLKHLHTYYQTHVIKRLSLLKTVPCSFCILHLYEQRYKGEVSKQQQKS